MGNKNFNYIMLIGRPHVPGVPETLNTVKDFLLSLNINVVVEEQSAECMRTRNFSTCTTTSFPKEVDLILVVGGDGSLLNAAHIAIEHNLPIIGVHRGRLGFLTDIHPGTMTALQKVLEGHYKKEFRSLLKATVHQQNTIITDIALNDVVLMPNNAPNMVEFETYIDDQFVCKQRADGLIIATPTGSTAYALSAGGPILEPQLKAVTLAPICPHTLSSRPIIVSLESKIEIHITENNKTPINVSCDGIQHIPIKIHDRIQIEQYNKQLCLIHPHDYSYFKTLREKLGWEKHAERT